MYYRVEKQTRDGWLYVKTYIETQSQAEALASLTAWRTGRKIRVVEVDITNLKSRPRVVATY